MDDQRLMLIIKEAQGGDKASIEKLLDIFHPLLYKYSIIGGNFDEDLFQELSINLIHCINSFQFKPDCRIYQSFEQALQEKSLSQEEIME